MQKIRYALSDCLVLSWREAKHLTRRLDTMVTTVVLPLVILLLFVYLFGGAIGIALGGGNYLNYLLPGILLTIVGYCATTTATSVSEDTTKGIVERFKTMPIARPAFMLGHIFGSVIRNIVAMALVIGVALLMGYTSTAGFTEWLLAVVILLCFAFALSAFAVVLGLLASGPDAASALGMPLMFLSYFTGALVPIDTMPKPLQIFCTYQPLNAVWKAVSSLLSGNDGFHIAVSFLWCAGIAIVSLVLGGVLFARKVAK
ncbi:MAG: ABC transporter permease [Oscillospiraceae bacterium]|jgi:ABC-2 type transport system permease protein|nr:ABC transporter permease [Oscillospiraceae bacterium]